MSLTEKYDRLAAGFSEHDYADPERYAAHRAAFVVGLGPKLHQGESVLDLGCGDAFIAGPLLAHGLHYRGVDASAGMIAAAGTRHPELEFVVARSEDYAPPEPVDATICLRAFFYPEDRLAFFRNVAAYTRKKFVFDFRPRARPAGPILRDLREAGFSDIRLRPFFLPQQRRLPELAVPLVYGLERSGPLASLVSRWYGRVFCSASVRP